MLAFWFTKKAVSVVVGYDHPRLVKFTSKPQRQLTFLNILWAKVPEEVNSTIADRHKFGMSVSFDENSTLKMAQPCINNENSC